MCALPLAGCSAYADGAVVRRADGYVARSNCGAGSDAQLTKVTVSVLPPRGSRQPKFVWWAEATGAPAYEVPLLVPSQGVRTSPGIVPTIAPGSEVEVDIETITSLNGGASFQWDAIPVGRGLYRWAEGPVAEAEIPAPAAFAKGCGGGWSKVAQGVAQVWIGVAAIAGIAGIASIFIVASRRRRSR